MAKMFVGGEGVQVKVLYDEIEKWSWQVWLIEALSD
jgi:hypothetical protein